MSLHRCHALGCPTPCRPEHLMCLRHWRMVPEAFRVALRAAYRPGQCVDKRPSLAWMLAATRCRLVVAERDGNGKAAGLMRRVLAAREGATT